MKRTLLFLCLALCGPLFAGSAVELHNPTYRFDKPKQESNVATAIKQGLIAKGWQVTGEGDQHILASLHLRRHVVEVRINYNANEFQVIHLRSEKLKYKKTKNNQEFIHEAYYRWLRNLEIEVTKAMYLLE